MTHVPVMAGEVMQLIGASPNLKLIDLTVGAGGHASEFLAASAPAGRVWAVDRDRHALAAASARLADFGERVSFVHADWLSALRHLASVHPDAILLDLGLSSMQLDDSSRGFSLRGDARLDMRMDERQELDAAGWLAAVPEKELERVLHEWGGEGNGRAIARAIVERRAQRPVRTAGDLRRLVEEATGRRAGRIHPATRTFQAVRMAVNREMEQLEGVLPAAYEALAPGGRLIVISFHSGEDRIVKQFFRDRKAEGARLLTPKARRPAASETASNPRSRSARLRALQKAGEVA